MTNVYNLPPDKQRYRAAAEWVTRLDRRLSKNEEEQLRRWLDENPEHRKRFLEVAEQWDRLSELTRLADLFPEPVSASSNRSRRLVYAMATLFIAVTVGFVGLRVAPDTSEEPRAVTAPPPTAYETAIGEQSTVVLSGGSRVTLNTNSHLTVRYTDFHRVLKLARGEMHVDVAPDRDRPLTVFAGDKMVQAVGTSFGVEIRDERNIEVVVTEGKVLVAVRPNTQDDLSDSQAPVLPPSTLTVEQGEEIRLGDNDRTEVRVVSAEDVRARLAWRSGDLVFRDEPLGEAVAEVGRYTTIEFVFLDDELKDEMILGRYKAGDVESFLAGLRENMSIAYERTVDGRILLGSR